MVQFFRKHHGVCGMFFRVPELVFGLKGKATSSFPEEPLGFEVHFCDHEVSHGDMSLRAKLEPQTLKTALHGGGGGDRDEKNAYPTSIVLHSPKNPGRSLQMGPVIPANTLFLRHDVNC